MPKLKIVLTENQWKRISELSGSGGLLMFGSTVIPLILDKSNLIGAFWGIVVSVFLWYISIQSAKKY